MWQMFEKYCTFEGPGSTQYGYLSRTGRVRMWTDPQDGTDWGEVRRFARKFAALGNPMRLRLYMGAIQNTDPMVLPPPAIQQEIADRFGIAASTFSHHMRTLEDAGLIERQRDGQRVISWAPREALHEMLHFDEVLAQRIEFFEPPEAECCNSGHGREA